MKTIILKRLVEIEEQYKIKILFSCESGSRAWGFPSPDSDYDVRFIYHYPMESYLSVFKKVTQLNFPINGELDINGWDLSKVLQLINKSNTTPFEWLQSAVIYKKDMKFKEELWQICRNYFHQKSHIHHYLGVARGAMKTINNENIKIKKLFYILRPLLAALWCVKHGTIAPMNIYPLMELLSDNLHKKVLSLIELKSTVTEGYQIKIENNLREWIDTTFDYCSKNSLQIGQKVYNTDEVDLFFRKIIQKTSTTD